jgi:hypothetical protein
MNKKLIAVIAVFALAASFVVAQTAFAEQTNITSETTKVTSFSTAPEKPACCSGSASCGGKCTISNCGCGCRG